MADELRDDIRTNMRGLLTDLAATAEQDRAGARATPSAANASAASGRRMLKEAEVMLAEFRNDIRTELRRASDNSLDGLALETLRTVLDQARISIESALGHRRPES